MSELKRCPFCGGKAHVEAHKFYEEKTKDFTVKTFGIICDNCHTSGGQFYKSEQEAIETWNTRKPVDDVLVRLENASYWTQSTFDEDGYCNDDSEEVIDLYKAIEILKEVMGYD